MSLFRFSKLPKSKAFTFTPRFYDPVKEELVLKINIKQMLTLLKNLNVNKTLDYSLLLVFFF
jgi:hypothetical protein